MTFLPKLTREKTGSFTVSVQAPYAPQENPIENVWGQLKQMLRQMHFLCRSFQFTQKLFEMLIEYRLFTPPNLSEHDAFSNII